MFIRSQDKTKLIPAGKHAICVRKTTTDSEKRDIYIVVADNIYNLGIYSTKERAIEVLGWIMEAIENEENTLQMPQELEPVFTGTKKEMKMEKQAVCYGEGIAPYCPRCRSGEYLHNEDGNENNFCGQCGCPLDWSRMYNEDTEQIEEKFKCGDRAEY